MIAILSSISRSALLAGVVMLGLTSISMAAPDGPSQTIDGFGNGDGACETADCAVRLRPRETPPPRREHRRRDVEGGHDRWPDDNGWRRRHHRRDHYRYDREPTIFFDINPQEYRYVEPRRVVRRLPRAHVAWCKAHYRSYRVATNSFQPNRGPRRECNSPYF
jgi:hypothetical protein